MMRRVTTPICDLVYGRHHWDFRLGTYLALLRTMSIRSMVARLYAGSELRTQTFTRLQRTRELIATLIVEGLDSELGEQALSRIRAAHRGVKASGDEYRYVLSVFFLEPMRFNREHGVKAFSDADLALLFAFWMDAGERMGVRELLPSLAAWQAFHDEFEGRERGATPEGQSLAAASLYDVVRLVIPRGLQGLTRQALLGTMQPAVRETLDLPRARVPATVSVAALRAISVFGAGKRVPTLRTPADQERQTTRGGPLTHRVDDPTDPA
jgi:hypothetical protein